MMGENSRPSASYWTDLPFYNTFLLSHEAPQCPKHYVYSMVFQLAALNIHHSILMTHFPQCSLIHTSQTLRSDTFFCNIWFINFVSEKLAHIKIQILLRLFELHKVHFTHKIFLPSCRYYPQVMFPPSTLLAGVITTVFLAQYETPI